MRTTHFCNSFEKLAKTKKETFKVKTQEVSLGRITSVLLVLRLGYSQVWIKCCYKGLRDGWKLRLRRNFCSAVEHTQQVSSACSKISLKINIKFSGVEKCKLQFLCLFTWELRNQLARKHFKFRIACPPDAFSRIIYWHGENSAHLNLHQSE